MRKIMRKFISLALSAAVTVSGINAGKLYVKAEEDDKKSVSVIEINYDDLTMTIKGNDDNNYYISDSQQRVWENLNGIKRENGSMTFDISWLSNRVSKIISVKGDVSEKPVTVNIPKYNNKFEAKYEDGNLSYSGVSASFTGKIQWRLNGSSIWKDTTTDPSKDPDIIANLAGCQSPDSATIVYFRMASANGTSDTNPGSRPSNESRVILPKLEGVVDVKVDNNHKKVKVPKYISYRTIGDTEWSNPTTSEKDIELSDLIKTDAGYPGNGDYIVEFKASSASEKKYSNAYVRVRASSSSSNDMVAMNISQPATDINPVNMATVNVTSAAISVAPDYDAQHISVNKQQNSGVLYSTDRQNWYPAGNGHVNISWIDSNEKKVYIKGTYCVKDEDIKEVTIPGRPTGFKAVFDRTSSAEAPKINISGISGVTKIQWRKSQSYKWNDITASPNGEFIDPAFENLRVKSGKIIVRAAAENGKRPSNECTAIIARRPSMPNVRFNSVSMTINTNTSMEYYDSVAKKWTACTKGMNIWLFPDAKNKAKVSSGIDGTDVTLQIRKKATSNNGYSKVKYIYLEGQKKAPSISEKETDDVRYSSETKTVGGVKKKYHTIKFNKATEETKYQYVVVAKGGKFDETKANWKTVKAPVSVTLKGDKAVSGSKIYVRIKGANANLKKNTPAKIPSEANSFDIP